MPELLVRELDARTIQRLKERAEQNGRSLQGEAKAILESAADQYTWKEFAERAAQIRERLAAKGYDFGDSAEDIRADREDPDR